VKKKKTAAKADSDDDAELVAKAITKKKKKELKDPLPSEGATAPAKEGKKKKLKRQLPAEEETPAAAPISKKKKERKQEVVSKIEETPVALPISKKKKKRKLESGSTLEDRSEMPAEPGKKKKKARLNAEAPPKAEERTGSAANDRNNPFKVFVGGLAWAIKEATVRADFEECGPITRLDMPLNDEGRPSGNAFIYYKAEEGVLKALEYDKVEYHGRLLKVRRAVQQNGAKEGDKGKGKGKSKGDEKGNTKGKSKGGEVVEGASAPRKNDQTTVFVGGLPYDVSQDTLWRDFEECGKLDAVRMVKNAEGAFKGIAFIVFKDEDGVKKALEFDGDDYAGRKLRVTRAGEKPEKKGKGDAGKGKGKGKKGKGVCYKFKEGNCPHGDSCIFAHE